MAVKLAGVMVSAVVFFVVIARAFPQTLRLIVPPAAITLESEFLDYQEGGSYTVREYQTSYWSSSIPGGSETVLSRSFPNDPLRTAAGDLFDPVRNILGSIADRVISPLFYRPGRVEYLRAASLSLNQRVRNACTPTNMWGRPMTVIDTETVLSYATTVSRLSPEGWDVRYTQWFAPALDCLSLRSTTEKAQADGTFQLVRERRVVRVTKNSGQKNTWR